MNGWDICCYIFGAIAIVGPFCIVFWYVRAAKQRFKDMEQKKQAGCKPAPTISGPMGPSRSFSLPPASSASPVSGFSGHTFLPAAGNSRNLDKGKRPLYLHRYLKEKPA